MKLSPVVESLFSALEEIPVVDTHEHLSPERIVVQKEIDLLTLFDGYVSKDLSVSGMPPEYWGKLRDNEMPVEERWKLLAPYLENVKYGAYAQAPFIAIKDLYVFDDINETNCEAISKRVSDEYTPGIYNRILREKCNIQFVIPSGGRTDYDVDFMKPVMPPWKYSGMGFAHLLSKERVEKNAAELGEEVKTLDDYIRVIRKALEIWKSKGAVGLKMHATYYETTERTEAVTLFRKMMREQYKVKPASLVNHSANPLFGFLLDEICNIATELELVVAFHTGVWGDFRELDPQLLIPVMKNHPEIQFDLYHAGIPYIREMAIMAKNFSNMWFNMCWAHLISPKMMQLLMDELIDLVPMNKIIAFGGDYGVVQNVYGSLKISRQQVAKVLGGRIEEGLLSESEAIEIAKKWYYENPKKLYQLKV